MTAWFQGLLGAGWGWFIATFILILLIALPLMLAVAMIIYVDRKIWAAMALRRGPTPRGSLGITARIRCGLPLEVERPRGAGIPACRKFCRERPLCRSATASPRRRS